MRKDYGRDLEGLKNDRDHAAETYDFHGGKFVPRAKEYNAGQLFEYQMAVEYAMRHDGRPGKTDMFEGARRYEVKFFTERRDENRDSRHSLRQHSAHLPAFDRSIPVADSIHRYCMGFDKLLIGHGDFSSGNYTIQVLARGEAEAWLLARVQAKGGSAELRVKWKPNEGLAGEKCHETMRKWGWLI